MRALKILYFVTEDWYFWSHRLPIARAARNAGFEVLVAARVGQYKECIENEGFRLIPIGLERKSRNIFNEVLSIFEIIKIYRREKPDIVHHVAIKPILYGSFAAWIASVPYVINAFTGLGFIFIKKGWLATAIRKLIVFIYRFVFLSKNTFAIFQNPEDLKLFVDLHIVQDDRAVLIRGSGVDVTMFAPTPEPSEPVVVVLPARMLYDKGVVEFVDAARILMRKNYRLRCILVGDRDPENPAVVSQRQIQQWQEEGVVGFWGHQADMPAVLAKAHIVCLPSYREGLPKALLEAASCGKPIIATDVPGCREIVREGINGFLVPPGNSIALAEALIKLITNKELRLQMGSRGREIVLRDFSEQRVITETLAIYQRIFAE